MSLADFAVILPVGPAPIERERLDDLCAALAHHEPGFGPVLFLNDGNDPAYLASLLPRHGLRGEVLTHPSTGQGDPWLSRLTVGYAHAFAHIQKVYPGHHAIKLDSDALVIAPFRARLTTLLAAHPDAGMFGSVSLNNDGSKGGSWWASRVYLLSKPFSRWPEAPRYRQHIFGVTGLLRRLIRRAIPFGYPLGICPCGGAYLVTARALQGFATLPELSDKRILAQDYIIEDAFFPIASYACGLTVVEQNAPGDVFGVCWKGLPGNDLDAVAARGNALIHSLKDHGPFREADTRAFFRARRLARPA